MSVFERVDAKLGDRIEEAVRNHHRRRLRKLGWLHALDVPSWGSCGPAPRTGNKLEVLVDGEQALPAIANEIASAQSHVHLAGWFFSHDLELNGTGTLRDVLGNAAERVDVRVLAWAGSPLPLFHPDRRDVRDAIEKLTAGTRIRTALDAKERPMHCHHEKLAIVDDRIAFVGGVDLTTLGGDRFDFNIHPPRDSVGWHDACARLEGPSVADVSAHFALRWKAMTGKTLEPAQPGPDVGGTDVRFVRTVPERLYPGLERGEFTILAAYLAALRGAQEFIYLENQFLWSPEIVATLAEKLRRPPTDEFRIVVLLPAHPNNGRDDTRGQLGVLAEADHGNGRLNAFTLHQPGTKHSVYVHAKIGIVDDCWLTIGSANLNEHSLFNDTEVNIVTTDAELVKAVRLKLWEEHLEAASGEIARLPVAHAVDEWWRRRAEDPRSKLARLPGISRRSRALLGPIDGLFVDG